MGEDIEVENIVQRLKDKHGVLKPPEDMEAKMEYWGIVKTGDKFSLGKFQYEKMDDATAYGQKKLDVFFKNSNWEDYKSILMHYGYEIEGGSKDKGVYRLSLKDKFMTLRREELAKFFKSEFSPKEIRQCLEYLNT